MNSVFKIIHCDITAFMKKTDGFLTNIWQDGKAACFEFETSSPISVHPGQFLMVRGGEDILPVPVYPGGLSKGVFTSMSSAGSHWGVGDQVSINGPYGKGFEIPQASRRLVIVSGTSTPLRLIPCAVDVIYAGGEVAMYAKFIPDHIPTEVELLSKDHLGDAVAWADCIIGDARYKSLSKWFEPFSGVNISLPGRGIQILVDTPLVCAGATECGVCSVKTKHGWKRACSDGPVFKLDDLEIA
jgi:NAD(P)H-flavin reductase